MIGWQETTLAALCKSDGLIQTGPFGSQLHMSDYTDSGVPVIMPTNIGDGRVDSSAIMRTSDEKARSLSRHMVRPGDIVYSRRGDITKRALIRDCESGWLCGTGCLLVRPSSHVIPRWLSYWLAQRDTHRWLLNHAVGATMLNLNTGILSQVPVSLPPLEEQERIAGVLGAFDDLIETNKRLASNMRTLAQVEARRGMSGRARTTPLTEVATVDKGYSYKSAELVGNEMVLLNLKNAGRGGHFRRDGYKPLSTRRHKSGHIVQPGDVIVAMTDLTQDRDIIARPLIVQAPNAKVEIVASLDLTVVRPKGVATREYIWAALSDPAFRNHALGYCSGTTVLHMKGTALSEYLVPSPDEDLLERLAEVVEPLLRGADEIDLEADALMAQRDELLPSLMSGRVRVRDLEAVA